MRTLRRYGISWTIILVAAVAIWIAVNGVSFGAQGPSAPAPRCATTGTPEPGVVDVKAWGCEPAGVGTPVAAEGLHVVLTLSSDQAAPQDIVVVIRDDQGHPVDDANVILINRHLEMNMGDFVRELVHDRDGRYLGDQVGMGMGGRWQTEIQVTRPGRQPVTFIFAETLQGLS